MTRLSFYLLMPEMPKATALQRFEACIFFVYTRNTKSFTLSAKKLIEWGFADAEEKHAMRYTHYRGLA